MDLIERAISKNLHITQDKELQNHTWDEFIQKCVNKKVFIWGIGEGTHFFWKRCGNKVCIEGIIDNDKRKQGHLLGEFFEEANETHSEKLIVSSVTILNEYNPNDVVILITSTKYYEDIVRQLKVLNILNCFSLLIMEYWYRKDTISLNHNNIDEFTIMSKFAEECVDKEEIHNNKIVFWAFGGYEDHGKYITEALLKLKQELDIVWLVNDISVKVPEQVRVVYSGKWKQYIYEMETAKMWIFDAMVPEYIIKREKQIYIQTKHWASITLKRFFLDAPSVNNISNNLRCWKQNGKWMDYIIVGSEFDKKSCVRGFNFTGRFLEFGSPRSDILFKNNDYKEKICNCYKLDKHKSILLYAPTYRFRKGEHKETFVRPEIELDYQRLVRNLKKKYKNDWYIFLRFHPAVAVGESLLLENSNVIDVSNYSDSQELVAASDIVISDFSSLMFEPAFIGKPVFLFASDMEQYEKNEYELLLNYKELPFPKARTNDELEECINKFDLNGYQSNVKKFLQKYGVHEDGRASERTAQFIRDILYG